LFLQVVAELRLSCLRSLHEEGIMKVLVGRILRPFTITLGALALFTGITPPVLAQQKGTLEEIVVTARYRQEALQETPIAITALTAEDLKVRAFTDTYQVGYTVPNASFRPAQQAFGNTMTAYIRGIGQYDFDFAFEPGVGVYIDDVYQPFLLGTQLDLLDLERVEVLRGPQGTLFGRGSIGGAMRLVSKRPEGDNSGYIEVTAGDYNRTDVRAAYDFALTKNLYARVSGVARREDGYQKRIDFACKYPAMAGTLQPEIVNRGKDCVLGTLGGTNVNGMRGMLRWIVSDNLESNLAIDYLKDDSEARADTLSNISGIDPATGQYAQGVTGAYAAYNAFYVIPTFGIGYDSRFIPSNPYVTYATFRDPMRGLYFKPQTTFEKWSVSDKTEWKINDYVSATAILAWTRGTSFFATDADGSPFNFQTVDGKEQLDSKTAELRFSGRLWDRMDYTVGGFYYHSKATNWQTVSLPPFSYTAVLVNVRNSSVADAEAGFGHVDFDLTDQVRLTAGVRFSHDKKNVDFDNNIFVGPIRLDSTHFDWKVGASYQYTDDIMLYADVSTGYRPGSYNPRPFSAAQAAPVSGEEQTAYEGGIKADLLDQTLRMNVAGFYSDYSKRIVPIGGTECLPGTVVANPTYGVEISDTNGNFCLTPTSLTGYINVPAKIYGAEVEATWRPVEPATITGTFGWLTWDSPDLAKCDFNNDGVPDLVPGTYVGVNVPAQCNSTPAEVPDLNWSIGASYEFPAYNGSTLTPRVDVYGQSKISFGALKSPNGNAPSYELVNLSVAWASPQRSWTATLGVTNLTNKAYILNNFDLSAFGQATSETQYGKPRAWYFTVRRDFQ
jgi:iron complex outermembrane receptor protein